VEGIDIMQISGHKNVALRGKFAEKLHWYQSISISFSVAEDV
jgi:hypothetical protein